jgi:acetoin utilization protein AcuC
LPTLDSPRQPDQRQVSEQVCVYLGQELAAYSFGADHPFGPQRHDAFAAHLSREGLAARVRLRAPVAASQADIELFHTHVYVERVKALSRTGTGWLDQGDTPAFLGMYEAAAVVAGSVLDALESIIRGDCRRGFVPIAGLHHARRDAAAGFCVFNDCAIAIEALRQRHGIRRIAYVDIDAHHGDGVYYGFEDDPELIVVDLHEDGRYLYPGSGSVREIGRGSAAGSKLNIPMPPGAGDTQFREAWRVAERFLQRYQPEFILFQCGADSLAGDPITDLQYTEASHALAAQRLCRLADSCCNGRILALGGGGYKLDNLARAWCAVVSAFVATRQ